MSAKRLVAVAMLSAAAFVGAAVPTVQSSKAAALKPAAPPVPDTSTAAAVPSRHAGDVAARISQLSHSPVAAPAQILKGMQVVGHGIQTSYTAYSSNWSGYVDTSEVFTHVLGSWTVPSAHCGTLELSQSSTWVGIDGWGNDTVEQLGTSSGCVAGLATYYAWTEMYPALPIPVFHSLSPGDSMTASVDAYFGGSVYLLVIRDLSKDWSSQSIQFSSPADQDLSAEWVTERPSCPIFCTNLTNFGAVTFHNAAAVGNGSPGSIASFPSSPVDMDNGNLEAQVSTLSPTGTSFTDSWDHS